MPPPANSPIHASAPWNTKVPVTSSKTHSTTIWPDSATPWSPDSTSSTSAQVTTTVTVSGDSERVESSMTGMKISTGMLDILVLSVEILRIE